MTTPTSKPAKKSDKQLFWVSANTTENGFPPVSSALRSPDGLLAMGGKLDSEHILEAYRLGIFPWSSAGQPILWWSPDPRWVIKPNEIKISRSLAKTLRKEPYQVTFNQAFDEVIQACAKPRQEKPWNNETWLTPDMIAAYTNLHKLGWAVSVECWQEQNLVGGLYGLAIGKVFFGESMFSRQSDASKIALVQLARKLHQSDFLLIDCQVYSPHIKSLGAKPMPREQFATLLRRHYQTPSLQWATTTTE